MIDRTGPIPPDTVAPASPGAAGCLPRPADPAGLRIGVISNPLSGANRKGLQPVEKMLAACGNAWHLQAVNPEEVKEAIRDFACRGVNHVAVNGGDGTIHAVLTALFTVEWPGQLPSLALLRAGTASMIARDVGLQGSRLQGLSRLLDWAQGGPGAAYLVKRPVLRLEWENGGASMYGMFFGAGVICEGIRFCLARVHTKGVGGELAAGLTLVRFLLAAARGDRRTVSAAPIRMGLEGTAMQDMEIVFLMVTTLERLFLGIRPYWGTEGAPLHFTAIRSDATDFLWTAPFLIRGRRNRRATPGQGYLSHNLSDLRLCIQSGFTLDGQLYQSDSRLGALRLSKGGEVEFLNV